MNFEKIELTLKTINEIRKMALDFVGKDIINNIGISL